MLGQHLGLLYLSCPSSMPNWRSRCNRIGVDFGATVCKTVRPMLSVRLSVCPDCPVCNVGVLWPNGLTDQDETWHAGSPRPRPHCVIWEPSSPSPKGHSPSPLNFCPYLLRPNGCMDHDATWYGANPQPRRLCVRWGPRSTLPKRGIAPSPIFGPFLLWPNGCMHQDATWYGDRPQPRGLCVR